MDDRTKKLITMLKQVRAEKKLTPQAIVDLCAENGDYVSISTVKRVFSPDSENMGFRYDTSIRPIARALLGLGDDPLAASQLSDDSASETNALRALIEVKNLEIVEKDNLLSVKDHMIEGLEAGIKDREQELTRVRDATSVRIDERNRTIDFLKSDLSKKDEEISQLKKSNRWRTIAIVILVILLLSFMMIAIGYLAWDLTHPTQGYFQWETSSYY